MAAGGIAIGALLGITGVQLSAGLRSQQATPPEPEPTSVAEAPVGFLADSPRAKPKPASSMARRDIGGAGSAAGRSASRSERDEGKAKPDTPSPPASASAGAAEVAPAPSSEP